MEDVVKKIIERLPRETAGNFEAGRDALKHFKEIKETKKSPSDFLKNIDSISEIRKLIGNKKLTNNQIRAKIKEFLNDPEELKDFLTSLLNKSNKKETKEATSTGGSSGVFITKMGGSDEISNPNTKNVPTVREEESEDDIKKIETKEATTSASSGQYSQPAIWAKSLKKKDFRGYAKPLYKGGKFVQVKKKCKKFPYCNQGDIKALKIFENESVQNAIDSVSSRYNIDKEYISDIVFEQIRKTQR
jgi:hypothetical protein